MLTAAQIDSLRSLGHQTLRSTVDVYRLSTVSNGAEGDDAATFTYVTTVPGWLHEVTPSGTIQQEVGGTLGVPELFQLYVPPESDVLPGDRVVVDGSHPFTVEHTSDEDTYRLFLTLTLRKRT